MPSDAGNATAHPSSGSPSPVTCRKTRYSSHARARKAMRGLSARLRAYSCPRCGGWHLTKDAE